MATKSYSISVGFYKKRHNVISYIQIQKNTLRKCLKQLEKKTKNKNNREKERESGTLRISHAKQISFLLFLCSVIV